MDLSRVGYVIGICEYDERGKVVLRPDFRGQRLNLYFRDLTDGVGIASEADIEKTCKFSAKWILRLASSIKQGTVTASLILRKLGAYPRQNSLALALRELGRLERTLFTLQWLQSPELRQRVQLGLNKGQAKNALARAVFFNRLGELRDRSFENHATEPAG
jgi:TnpA family transposase